MPEVSLENRLIIAKRDIQRDLMAIARRLHKQKREATPQEKAQIIELQRRLQKVRRGELA